jgi:CheY-like chemotaxis protein
MSQEPKQRVFVVDGENVISSTFELILMSRGFGAHSFADPLAALQAAQSQSPDLLITDVMMPKMIGIELAVRIRRDYPNCKVMLFSGQVSIINSLAQGRAEGHEFVLVDKPIHPAVLLERISEVLQDAGGFA